MPNLPREQRRAEIVEATIRLMQTSGLPSATVRGVAEVLKSSPGQIHHHFSSVGALRAEAFRELTRRTLAESDAALASLDPLARVFALLEGGSVDSTDALNPSLCREAVEVAGMSEELRALMREALEAWSLRITAALAEARTARQLPLGVNVEVLAQALLLLATGADVMRQIGASELPLKDIIKAQIAVHIRAATDSPGKE
jgi:AcrR family transcriptional regulator